MPFTICIRIPTASDSGDTGNPKLVDLRTSVSKNSDGPANGQKERRTGGNKGKAKEAASPSGEKKSADSSSVKKGK